MTKQKAFEFLVRYIDNYDPDTDYADFCDAMNSVYVLAPPKIDPETGLLPCGCGGVPQLKKEEDCQRFGMYVFCECSLCGTRTRRVVYSEKEAKKLWNQAFGKEQK
jgi:hypothetical protein